MTKVRLVPGFKEKMEYFYTFKEEKIHKTVVMFLGESAGEDVKISWEHSDHKWVTLEEGKKILKDKKKEMIGKVHRFLSSRLENWDKRNRV